MRMKTKKHRRFIAGGIFLSPVNKDSWEMLAPQPTSNDRAGENGQQPPNPHPAAGHDRRKAAEQRVCARRCRQLPRADRRLCNIAHC
jgi:hypothetical protein